MHIYSWIILLISTSALAFVIYLWRSLRLSKVYYRSHIELLLDDLREIEMKVGEIFANRKKRLTEIVDSEDLSRFRELSLKHRRLREKIEEIADIEEYMKVEGPFSGVIDNFDRVITETNEIKSRENELLRRINELEKQSSTTRQ